MPDEKKKRFGLWKILAILAILIVGAIVAVPFFLDANQFKPRLESEMTDALGREVKIGRLKLSLLSGGVAADDLSVADDRAFGTSPFIHAGSLQVGVELKPLIFSKVIHITGIKLERPEITLIRSNQGVWNFSSIGSKPGADRQTDPKEKMDPIGGSNITISSFQVTDGRVSVLRGGRRAKPRIYDNVNIKARDLSFDAVFPFSLTGILPGGGSITLEGKAGPFNRGDALSTPLSASIAISRLDLTGSGFIDQDSGLTGLVDFSGSADSDGRHLRSKGSAKADKFQLVKGGTPTTRPILLNYTLDHDLKKQEGTLRDTRVEFGKAVARLDGSYDVGAESTSLKLKLRGEGMPAEDLQALLPAIAVTLPKGASLQGGTLDADLKAEGPVEKLVTTGTMGIVGTRLEGFDLGSKMTAVTSLAGLKPSAVTEIEKFASGMRIAPDGIQVSGLTLVVPALGVLTGDGTVSSNSALDFRMTAKLNSSKGALGGLSQIAGVNTGGEVAVPFFIRGTTSEPRFVPDVKGTAQSLLGKALSGKGTNSGQGSATPKLEDSLRDLFRKKKN